MPDPSTLRDLVDLVAVLRGPEGCPWDREQTATSIRSYLVEEAHELAAALDAQGWDEIRQELGDVLFQVAFVARLAEEAGVFRAEDVVAWQHRKMVERHPHVFGDESLPDAEAVAAAWERRKVEGSNRGALDGVPDSLPALVGAYRLTQKAAGVGFDWEDATGPRRKIAEELAELDEETTASPADPRRLDEEMGDLLFAVANLSRHLGIDPEAALSRANRKFRRRFAAIERRLREQGRAPADATLEEMDTLWNEAKEAEGVAARAADDGAPSPEGSPR